MLFKKIQNSLPAVNAASSLLRAAGRGIWGLAIPAILSVTNFGTYSILQTTASILAQISVLGAPRTILREPRKDLPLAGLLLHSMSILLVAFLIAYVLLRGQNFIFYVLLLLLSIAFIIYFIVNAGSKARLLFQRVLFAELGGFIVLLCGLPILLILSLRGGTYVNYSTVVPFEIFSLLIVIIFLLNKTGIASSELRTKDTFAILPSVYSIGFLVLFDIAIWHRIEIYFLQRSLDGLTGVAVFSLASQLALSFLILPAAVLEAWLPGFAESFSTSKEAHQQLTNVRFRKFVMLYLLFILLVLVTALFLLKFLFVKYSQWTPHIISILLIRVVSSFFWFYSTVLYATKKERALYLPVICGATVSLVSNSYFTLQYGLRGLLVAYSVTHLFISFTTFLAYRKRESDGQH